MSDKKIITIAIILAALLIGGGWYYSKQAPVARVSQPVISPTGAFESGILIGDSSAPVTMEEYTSFICPACARFASGALEQIKEEYVKTGKVKIIIYVLPPYELGRAALCGQEQNKFVVYHDYLFSHQDQISNEGDLKNMAVNAGLDSQKFNACFDANKDEGKLAKWYEEGSGRGVDSTPTFFINGQKLIGALPFDDFKKVIDQKLEQMR
ncbi:MAG: DsbA family protein [Candidatus Portnoybacteria bacterium]|nr:DsbA family protein [Candidatus Portnoybacteria bacterium]MDD4982957.1 DsbA family protein [Candidatus Portnoybacteria bacterium]